jgi:Methyltransferase domain
MSGARRARFFDAYPRFFQTSQTSPWPNRLNARHAAIIEAHAADIAGARVLDIASHDGRWSFAALSAGAAHVTGIEPRAELVAEAEASLRAYGIEEQRFRFITGDVFDHLDGLTFDVVLCLGFYYHTLRHAELLDRIERTGARLVVVDTEVTPAAELPSDAPSDDPRRVYGNPFGLHLLREAVDDQRMGWHDRLTRDGHTLVARPSRAAIRFMGEHFGYAMTEYNWPSHFARHPGDAETMVDYAEGWRGTYSLRR